jgi:hypothetical protein
MDEWGLERQVPNSISRITGQVLITGFRADGRNTEVIQRDLFHHPETLALGFGPRPIP